MNEGQGVSDVQQDNVELVIPPRPQISVETREFNDVVIQTSAIAQDYETVRHEEVLIPLECVPEVVSALQRIWERHGKA